MTDRPQNGSLTTVKEEDGPTGRWGCSELPRAQRAVPPAGALNFFNLRWRCQGKAGGKGREGRGERSTRRRRNRRQSSWWKKSGGAMTNQNKAEQNEHKTSASSPDPSHCHPVATGMATLPKIGGKPCSLNNSPNNSLKPCPLRGSTPTGQRGR